MASDGTTTAPNFTPSDLTHLRRAVALAAESLAAGDAPFGSVLVSSSGEVLAEDRNRIATLKDATKHPEFELSRWAVAHIPSAEERGTTTMYTSGEHCPMCAAAHAFNGLGRIIYVASGEQLAEWRTEFKGEQIPVRVAPLAAQTVAPNIEVLGPVPELQEKIREIHREYAKKNPRY
ncbi:cytidine deaminase-like protein [Xylaria telfairii]|nr:cytidine deaminase-like protein [Xylaria telfairii]